MTASTDCSQNRDPLRTGREGTSQEQRFSPALDPAYVPVDERTIAHWMVFARAYSGYLTYYDSNNAAAGDWEPFFSEDVSVLLAVPAVQDVEYYRQNTRDYLDFLNDRHNQGDDNALRDRLDYLFSCCAALALRLDRLTTNLPKEIGLKKTLQNLVQSRLAPALKRLIAYRKGGEAIADGGIPVNTGAAEKAAPIHIMGGAAIKFSELATAGLSTNWTNGPDWTAWYNAIAGDDSVYGTLAGTDVFDRVNHIATHNLFTSILDEFLKVHARIVIEANSALEKTLSEWDRHAPHYALFLAFLRLFKYARAEANTLTQRHLDFYYREILRLKERPAEPGKAHLLLELAKQARAHELKSGELFKAGKDGLGIDAYFANDRVFVANQAKVAALKTVYRHGEEKVGLSLPTEMHNGRIYASLATDSDDGQGAELTSPDQSWHPFYNKIYQNGMLSEIRMPEAEIGFAIASHYLWMAEGARIITIVFYVGSSLAGDTPPSKDDIACWLTGEKGWFEKDASKFIAGSEKLELKIELSGADPAVVPWSAKTHGYDFPVELPVLLVKLKHQDTKKYGYDPLRDVNVNKIDLTVDVKDLRSLAVSNDFGPVDTSRPFQPFGSLPVNGAGFTVGSREVFQKNLDSATLKFVWQNTPSYYISTTTGVVSTAPTVAISYLRSGAWNTSAGTKAITTSSYPLDPDELAAGIEAIDFSENEPYSLVSRNGYVRLIFNGDSGFNQYQIDLVAFLTDADPKPASHPGPPVLGAFASSVTMAYAATQKIILDSSGNFEGRTGHFYHIAPFGQAEQHPDLSSGSQVSLVPQFDFQFEGMGYESEAEFYIGVTGLKPPQNLSLLFQAADGTADPLSVKPESHIHWSYLRGNEWTAFAENDVEDRTGGLLDSGIITFAMPRDATDTDTLLPTGMHWIRAAAASETDAVCRLRMAAAQAVDATFQDNGNDPAFSAGVLPSGTISKLDSPVAAVKKITQPFETFGGRGKETSPAFYTRISERLRHKDRAIALWDYKRLVLEAFPQIYKVKCLNHTHYETDGSGGGIYKELAPGHVTIVTIPDLQFQNLSDPFRPFTSLGLLEEIEAYLRMRLSCFVKLHVRNPRFEEVWVDFNVRFHEGVDVTFHENKLNEAISRFLSPWAFPGGGSPSFGGKIHKSVLINFVEEQPYVDYVTDFKLFHAYEDVDGNQQTVEKNEMEGSKAVSILVSARQHTIVTIEPAGEATSGEKCPCEA